MKLAQANLQETVVLFFQKNAVFRPPVFQAQYVSNLFIFAFHIQCPLWISGMPVIP